MLIARGLAKRYGGVTALRDVTLKRRAGSGARRHWRERGGQVDVC